MFNKLNRNVLLAGVAMAGIAAVPPAFAQEASPSANDIIVTAQRIEQRLQDVPISITVFNQQQLAQRNIAVATDLAAFTPSLSVNQRYGPEKAVFNIRGFNQDNSTAPTVGVYFAEVIGLRAQGGTMSGNSVGAGAFTDLQNVQVLKGPQGTLFGRNTTGGAILLTPAKPTGELKGFIEGTYGNFDQKKVTGMINIPLADTFKVRAVVERNKRDGYMHNLSGVGPSAYNDLNYTYARLSILAELTPDLENTTIVHYSDSNTAGSASRIVGCATPSSPFVPLNTVAGTPGYSGTRHLQAASCAIQLARQTARGDGLYDIESSNGKGSLSIKQWQVINTTTWRASDHLTLKNIASYGEFRERANFDLGSSNFVVPNVDASPFPGDPRRGFLLTRINPALTTTGGRPGGIPLFAAAGLPYKRIVLTPYSPNVDTASQSTFTNEFQIQGNYEKLNFVLGAYLEFSRPIGFTAGRTAIFLDCTNATNVECANPLLFGSLSESATKLKFDNHAVFGQATYNLTDKFAITAGARYTFDKINGFSEGTRLSLTPGLATGPGFIDPIGGVRTVYRACTDSFRRFNERPALDRSVCGVHLSNKSNKPTWLIDFDYKPTPEMLLYAKYARGYRQGGLSFTNPGVESWQPEKTDNFELGAKTSFRGAVSGYFNLAAFYNKLSNQQIFAQLIPDAVNAAAGVAGGNAIINAGKSRIYGAEVDASALFFESLRFDLGYTYLNTKLTESGSAATRGDGSALGTYILNSPFIRISPSSVVGQPFTFTPKHRVTLTGTYTLPIDERIGRISVGATWVHTSKQINDAASPAFVNGIAVGVTPANDLVSANLDWKSVAHSPIDLSFFVTNLTKEKINIANTGAWSSAGTAEILLNQPRFYGARIRFNFGQ